MNIEVVKLISNNKLNNSLMIKIYEYPWCIKKYTITDLIKSKDILLAIKVMRIMEENNYCNTKEYQQLLEIVSNEKEYLKYQEILKRMKHRFIIQNDFGEIVGVASSKNKAKRIITILKRYFKMCNYYIKELDIFE